MAKKYRIREVVEHDGDTKALGSTDCLVILTRDEAIEYQRCVEALRKAFDVTVSGILGKIYDQLNEELEQQ